MEGIQGSKEGRSRGNI